MTREDVLNIARLVLAHCDGAISRDERGYDIFDAVTIRQILSPDIFGISELMNEEVEYLRLKLLRYKKLNKAIDYWRGLFCSYIATNLQNRHECCAFGSYIMEMRAAGLIPQENWDTPCLMDEARSCPLFNLRNKKGGFPQIDWPEEYNRKAFPLGALPIFEDTTSSIAREMKKWREEVRH